MIGASYTDPQLYVDYYKCQAGNGLPGVHGNPTMYGAGCGRIFKSHFRMVVPIIKRGICIVKPHLKTAAKGKNIITKTQLHEQHGSGLAAIAYKNTRRPPGRQVVFSNKKCKIKVRVKKSQRRNKHSSSSFSNKQRRLNIF